MAEEHIVTSVEGLRAVYQEPAEGAKLKSVDIIDKGAASLIAASPFLVFATTSQNGLDCSPKGGEPGFVQVLDAKTLLLPDWSGNNRIDGLQNLVYDPRVGLMFFYPGRGDVFRVNGTAVVSMDPELTSRFWHEEKHPRSVIVITVSEAFIHCSRAVTFGRLWEPESWLTDETMPDTGTVIRGHIAYSRARNAEKDH